MGITWPISILSEEIKVNILKIMRLLEIDQAIFAKFWYSKSVFHLYLNKMLKCCYLGERYMAASLAESKSKN